MDLDMGTASHWWALIVRCAAAEGLTEQRQIAARIGVSEGLITSWKRGVLPRTDTVMKAWEAFSGDPSDVPIFMTAAAGVDPKDQVRTDAPPL